MSGTIPWNRERLQLTPREYERYVSEHVQKEGGGLTDFNVLHPEVITTPDGDFEIDATARFEALGVDFLVLIECKHHKNPIKREVVQILRDRIRSTGAQKGILYSTSLFQSGALEYAEKNRIALVHLVPGLEPQIERRDGHQESQQEPIYVGIQAWSVRVGTYTEGVGTYTGASQEHIFNAWGTTQMGQE